MNFKHGFNSRNVAINPDCRMMGSDTVSSDDLVFADVFCMATVVKIQYGTSHREGDLYCRQPQISLVMGESK